MILSSLIIVIYFLCKKKFQVFYLVLLFLISFSFIPIILGMGVHWKSFYPFLCFSTLFLPLISFSEILTPLEKKINKLFYENSSNYIFLIIFILLYVFGSNVFPNNNFLEFNKNDEEFRTQMLNLQQKPTDKILVLRGGEPGGDSQTKWNKYYYWNNSFLFGEFDTLFKNGEFKILDVLCEIKSKNIKLIYKPNSIQMIPNHSGQKIYSKFLDILVQNPQIFVELFERKDPYKGKVYKISEKYFNKYLNNKNC